MKNGLGFEVIAHVPYCTCGHKGILNEKFDAYFCPDCDKWLESKCGDPNCRPSGIIRGDEALELFIGACGYREVLDV